jgi:HNH endonuclease
VNYLVAYQKKLGLDADGVMLDLGITDKLVLTQERLKQMLDYDPVTGVFKWLKRSGSGSPIKKGMVAGHIDSSGHRQVMVCGKLYMAHRLAWFYIHSKWPKNQIDHIDGDGSNNSLSNLREATPSQNAHNKAIFKSNTSGVKGVSYSLSHKKWRARVMVNNKSKHIGYFCDIYEAESSVKEARNKLHGMFANHG